jgi:hypothetical protein
MRSWREKVVEEQTKELHRRSSVDVNKTLESFLKNKSSKSLHIKKNYDLGYKERSGICRDIINIGDELEKGIYTPEEITSKAFMGYLTREPKDLFQAASKFIYEYKVSIDVLCANFLYAVADANWYARSNIEKIINSLYFETTYVDEVKHVLNVIKKYICRYYATAYITVNGEKRYTNYLTITENLSDLIKFYNRTRRLCFRKSWDTRTFSRGAGDKSDDSVRSAFNALRNVPNIYGFFIEKSGIALLNIDDELIESINDMNKVVELFNSDVDFSEELIKDILNKYHTI